ncbi:hypothetical protein LJ655_25490 [Paraburkholderia sp. MMS20-SJTN17]|uniref:OmpA-like domain-containing protein n=1 Tax=Paraburkholderia translucens TaxID=2886945 RepID=A0ABS8KK91_9BURK|nr:hypothetical protein [Paraburkholderia sp. MMS20-SJTN17]MCC8405189.1 hypothetical protein [Paraburkholderia sp. MMS20-SJTN17]
MAKKHTGLKWVLLISSFMAISTQACESSANRPAEVKVILFEKNSAIVPSKEVVDLALWAIDMKKRYPIHQWMTIGGRAAPDETNASKLAATRAAAVKSFTVEFGLTKAPIDVNDYVNSAEEAKMNGEQARSVQINLNPGCPNNCCDGQ